MSGENATSVRRALALTRAELRVRQPGAFFAILVEAAITYLELMALLRPPTIDVDAS
jgi:hypothetical protein